MRSLTRVIDRLISKVAANIDGRLRTVGKQQKEESKLPDATPASGAPGGLHKCSGSMG
jgi:hypothetical protein